MPVKTVTLSDSEDALIQTVRERLSSPQKGIKVSLMTYELEFDPRALKEWHKLGDTVKAQLKKSWLMCY